MGSFKHPRFFDPLAADHIRSVYNEIMDVLERQEALSLDVADRELKAAIIREIIKLFTDGTPPQYWKSKVLSSLPLWQLDLKQLEA
jgi:hypothetical protein